jgi:hypothetical protein
LSGTGPLWFALALLLFSAVYALLRATLSSPTAPQSPPGGLPTHKMVWGFVAALAVVTFLVRLVQPIGTDVINMQLCFFPQYVVLFAVGIVAYRRNWLLRIPRAFGVTWLRIALIAGPPLWVGALVGGRVWTGDFSLIAGGMHWQSALYCAWESLFCVGVCLGLTFLVRDYCNTHTPLTRWLSDNSFAVYVFHSPILIGLSLALHGPSWPPLAKFVLLSASSLAASFLFSHWVARRLPGLRRIL